MTRASGRCLDVVRVLRITQGAPAVEAVALSLPGRARGAARPHRCGATHDRVGAQDGRRARHHAAAARGRRVRRAHRAARGRRAAAERCLRAAYDGLRELGLGIDAARAAALLARALLAQDRVAEAEALSHESEALAGDDLKAAIAWRGVRAEALARRGEHAAAVEFASAAVEIAAATDALLDHADARLALAAALRAAGRGREADAEERRAIELWEAKGATLLAERATHAAAPVAAPIAATAPRAAHAPRRRPVRPNFAIEEMRRAEAAVAARDARALEALVPARHRDRRSPVRNHVRIRRDRRAGSSHHRRLDGQRVCARAAGDARRLARALPHAQHGLRLDRARHLDRRDRECRTCS